MEGAASEVYLDVQADVTLATFRAASRWLTWWNSGRWMAVVIIMLVLVAGLLSLLQEGFSMFVSLGFAAAIVGLLVLVLIMFATPRSRAMRALRQGHVHFLAKEDGYHVEGPFGSQTFRWAIYQKAYVDKRFIYLLLSDRIAQVIPLQLVTDREPLLNHLRKLGLLRPTPRTFILF